MKNIIILFGLMTIFSCSPFKSVQPSIAQNNLPSSCEGLVTIIKEKWKHHKKLEYYKYDESLLTQLQRDYRDCFMNLTKKDIIKLLGNPTENLESDYMLYALNEGCTGKVPQNCSVLYFQFKEDNGEVLSYQVQVHEAHIHNIIEK